MVSGDDGGGGELGAGLVHSVGQTLSGGGGGGKPVRESRREHRSSCVCVCVCVGLDTHVSTVCSGGAVGLLLQLDLLQLLSVHQGQLLLMLLVLFGCESCGRQTLV